MENMVRDKILITGINGYIGTVLAKRLQSKGFRVAGWDADYFKKIIIGPYKKTCFTKKRDIRQIKPDLKGIDCIIHLAALSNDPMGDLDEKLTHDINYLATVKLAKKAKKAGVKRFIFSSSCSVYGIAKETSVSEKSEINPLTAYAKSKVLTEKELMKLNDENFCVCLLRNATVYGFSPRFRNDLVVNNLITCGLGRGEICVLSDGTPWRPLIDVRDLSDIFLKFIRVASAKVSGEIFNVGFKENNFQVKKILTVIKKNLPECKIKFTGEHGRDTRSYKVNFSKLKKLFPDLKQRWPLEKSVKHLIIQLKKYKFTSDDFEKQRYVRLTVLKRLISEGKISKKLYWL